MTPLNVKDALQDPQSLLKELYVTLGKKGFPKLAANAFREAFDDATMLTV